MRHLFAIQCRFPLEAVGLGPEKRVPTDVMEYVEPVFLYEMFLYIYQSVVPSAKAGSM